jgi:O-antigen ligase
VVAWTLIVLITALSIGSGSRGIYIVLTLEWLILLVVSLTGALLNSLRLLSFKKLFLLLIAVLLALVVAAHWLSPQLFFGALQRGFTVDDRILSTWKPTMLFIGNALWGGYGFGPAIWNAVYKIYQPQMPGAINFGGAHNWLLQIGFLGGVPAIALSLGLIVSFFWQLRNILANTHFNLVIKKVALSMGLSFFAFYLIRGLVETPSWKPFYLLLSCFLYLACLSVKTLKKTT